jgi:hypothetical protein
MSEFLNFEAPEAQCPKAIGGILVAHLAATADFHRMTYEFKNADGSVKELPWPTDEQITEHMIYNNYKDTDHLRKESKEVLRRRQIAGALLDFVSDKNTTPEQNSNAALVLSSILTQRTGELMQNLVYGHNSPLKILSNKSTKWINRQVTLKDSKGQTHPVEVMQYGGMVFRLERDGTDFKVDVSLPTYSEAKDSYKRELPLHQDGVIGVHMDSEIRVDINAAQALHLSTTLPNGVRSRYLGRFSIQ